MRRFYPLLLLPLLAACAAGDSLAPRQSAPVTPAATAPTTSPLPAPSGRTAEALDTTSAAERAAALDVAPAAERELGTAIASLGSPSEAGIWLKTPLVTSVSEGRLVWTETGKSITVNLRPAEGNSGTTQISLAALRLLEAPLSALPELTIYAR